MKLKLLITLLFITGIVHAQTRQTGGISFTPQWNYKISGSDTTWQFGNTLMSPQQFPYFLTKWQSDQRYATVGGYVPNTRLVSTGYGLLGGGNLGSNLSLYVDTANIVTKTYGARWLTQASANSLYWKLNASNTSTGQQNITDGFTSGVSIGSNGNAGVLWGYDVPSKFLSTANISMQNGYTVVNGQGSSGAVDLSIDYTPKVTVLKDTTYIANKLRLQSVSTGSTSNDIAVIDGAEVKRIPGDSYVTASNAIINDSLTVGANYPTPTQSIIFHGDSYVAGSDATSAANRFTNQIATALNLTMVNNGINSTAWADFLNSSYFNSLPNYSASTFAIALKYGTNDAGNVSITPAMHSANVGAAIDSLHTIKGYPYNKIILIGTPYNYLNTDQAKLEEFARRDSLMAAQKGILFVEMYHYQKQRGGNSLYTSPGLHWNDNGHKSAFTRFMQSLGYSGLIGNGTINNSLTVKNKVTAGAADIITANITGFELHNGKIDTVDVTRATINYASITNPLDSLDFKLTGNVSKGRNTLLAFHSGTQWSGIGTKSAALQVFGSGGVNFGGGANVNATTLSQANSAMYIDPLNNFYMKNTAFANNLSIAGNLTFTAGDNTRIFNAASAANGFLYGEMRNSSGLMRIGINQNSGGGLGAGVDAWAAVFGNVDAQPVNFITSATNRYAIDASGNHDFKNGYLKAVLPTYSSGTFLPAIYNSTNSRFETASAANLNTFLGTFSNPMTTQGDIIYGGTSGTPTRLAKGASGYFLQAGASVPQYFDLFGSNNTWGAAQTFNGSINANNSIIFKGSSTGTITINASSYSGGIGYTQQLQPKDGTIALTSDIPTPQQIVEITGTSQTGATNTVYIPHNTSMTTISLPEGAPIGSLMVVLGEGAGKWRVQHSNGTEVIVSVGGFTTIAGSGKGAEINDQYGTASFRKIATDKWSISALNGVLSAY